jgi:hypothetical protein
MQKTKTKISSRNTERIYPLAFVVSGQEMLFVE